MFIYARTGLKVTGKSDQLNGMELNGKRKSELEFLKSLWGLGTEEEEGYRTGPPGYIGWRNSFLGIDSGAPYTFKNTGSVYSTLTALYKSCTCDPIL
jgi:hypothetical protein